MKSYLRLDEITATTDWSEAATHSAPGRKQTIIGRSLCLPASLASPLVICGSHARPPVNHGRLRIPGYLPALLRAPKEGKGVFLVRFASRGLACGGESAGTAATCRTVIIVHREPCNLVCDTRSGERSIYIYFFYFFLSWFSWFVLSVEVLFYGGWKGCRG